MIVINMLGFLGPILFSYSSSETITILTKLHLEVTPLCLSGIGLQYLDGLVIIYVLDYFSLDSLFLFCPFKLLLLL